MCIACLGGKPIFLQQTLQMVFATFFLLLVLSSVFNCQASGRGSTSFDEEEMDMFNVLHKEEPDMFLKEEMDIFPKRAFTSFRMRSPVAGDQWLSHVMWNAHNPNQLVQLVEVEACGVKIS